MPRTLTLESGSARPYQSRTRRCEGPEMSSNDSSLMVRGPAAARQFRRSEPALYSRVASLATLLCAYPLEEALPYLALPSPESAFTPVPSVHPEPQVSTHHPSPVYLALQIKSFRLHCFVISST